MRGDQSAEASEAEPYAAEIDRKEVRRIFQFSYHHIDDHKENNMHDQSEPACRYIYLHRYYLDESRDLFAEFDIGVVFVVYHIFFYRVFLRVQEPKAGPLAPFLIYQFDFRKNLSHTARGKFGNVFVVGGIHEIEKLIDRRFYAKLALDDITVFLFRKKSVDKIEADKGNKTHRYGEQQLAQSKAEENIGGDKS